MVEEIKSKPKKRIPVNVQKAGSFALSLLLGEHNKFNLPFDESIIGNSLTMSRSKKVFIAVDKKKPLLILGYVVYELVKDKAKLLRMSSRKGYESARIGRQLYGKSRAHLQRLGITKIETVGAREDASNFYLKKLHMQEIMRPTMRGAKPDFAQELTITKRPTRIKIAPPKGLAPQNIMNPLKLRRRR